MVVFFRYLFNPHYLKTALRDDWLKLYDKEVSSVSAAGPRRRARYAGGQCMWCVGTATAHRGTAGEGGRGAVGVQTGRAVQAWVLLVSQRSRPRRRDLPRAPCRRRRRRLAQFVDGIVQQLVACTPEMNKLLDALDDKVYFTRRRVSERKGRAV